MALPMTTDRAALAQKRVIQAGRTNPGDLLAQMGSNLYHAAYQRGMSLSGLLEVEAPSTPEELKQGLDGFTKMLQYAGIRTQSIPEIGLPASAFGEFDASDSLRALVPEFVARTWRRAQMGAFQTRSSAYLADDFIPGSLLNAWADQAGIRQEKRLAPAIPLSALIAQTTSIDGDAYRAFYMTDSAAQERMGRVGEMGEVPRAYLTGGEHTIRLRKYGRSFEVSYEVLRRTPIDRIAFHLARLAIQTEIDKVAAALDVLINGDGNANTAATSYNLTTLDPLAVAGTLTLKGWLAYKMKFANPYLLTAALVQEAVALQMILLNVGSANVPLVTVQNQLGIGNFTPINTGLSDGTRLGWTADAPALKIVGFDGRLGLERITETGSNIQEVDKYISRQSQVLVMTEVEGYAILDQNAAKILDINA